MNAFDDWFESLFGSAYICKVGTDHIWSRRDDYLSQSDQSLNELTLIKQADSASDLAPPLVTIVHNELPRLPCFLRHYRALGVRHFVIVDHKSTDRTAEILTSQPDVSLYRTHASYERSVGGQMWVTGLARRLALGGWLLHVDADELLVYDGMDSNGLVRLVQLLEQRRESRLYAPMVDMYPDQPIGRFDLNHGEDLLEAAPFFDPVSDDKHVYYEWAPSNDRTVLLNLARSRRLGSPLAETGRPVRYLMDKFPLSYWHEGTAYCSVHQPYPFAENPLLPSGALLHFKFVGDVIGHNRSVADIGEAWCGAIENRWYADLLEANETRSFYHDASLRYRNPQTLIDEGFINPLDWSLLG